MAKVSSELSLIALLEEDACIDKDWTWGLGVLLEFVCKWDPYLLLKLRICE